MHKTDLQNPQIFGNIASQKTASEIVLGILQLGGTIRNPQSEAW